MVKEIKLSVVIPAFNEEKRIKSTLNKIISFLKEKKFLYELIIVDDGSVDKTSEISEKILSREKINYKILKNDKNYGKGYSFKQGFLKSSGKYVLLCDADLSTQIEEVDDFFELMEEKNADIVIGIRTLKESPDILIKRKRFTRTISAKIFNKLVNFLFKLNFKDTQCGFKLFKKEKCTPVMENLHTKRFSFDVEILLKAKKNGLKIKEKQVIWQDSSHSSVKLLKDSFEMVFSLIQLKIKR